MCCPGPQPEDLSPLGRQHQPCGRDKDGEGGRSFVSFRPLDLHVCAYSANASNKRQKDNHQETGGTEYFLEQLLIGDGRNMPLHPPVLSDIQTENKAAFKNVSRQADTQI